MIQLGGDFYDYIQFKEPNKLGIFICDVSGHGVSAALVASMVKTLINTSGASKLKPAEFLHYINNKLIDQTSGHFVTAFYGIYDSDTKKLEYARGGHTFPYIVRDDKIIKLQSRGPLLALFNNIYIEQSEVQLKPNDKVLLYTDGLTEAKNSAGLMFESRLERHLLKIRHLEIDEYVENIYKTLVEFIGSEEIDDDVCMIGIRVG